MSQRPQRMAKTAIQTLNFKSPNAGQILDYFTLNASDYVVALDVNTPKTIQVTINAKDTEKVRHLQTKLFHLV